jgi:hypothetical protein
VRPGRPSKPGLRPALFVLVALCFLLPFGSVSCGGETVEATGIQLASRTVPGTGVDPDVGGPNLAQEVEDKAFVQALLALLAPALGLLLSIWRPQAIGRAFLVTLAGIAALLSLPVTAIAELADIALGPGFVFALALEVWLAVHYLISLARRRWPPAQRPRATRPRQILPLGAVPLSRDQS